MARHEPVGSVHGCDRLVGIIGRCTSPNRFTTGEMTNGGRKHSLANVSHPRRRAERGEFIDPSDTDVTYIV
jgi:hypothetical protein